MIDALLVFAGDTVSWLLVAPLAAFTGAPLAALLAGPVGQVARVIAFVILGVGGARIYAERQVEIATSQAVAEATIAISAARDRQQAAALAEITTQHSAEIKRIEATARFKTERIASVPVIPTCRVMPASGIALDQLRARRSAAGLSTDTD